MEDTLPTAAPAPCKGRRPFESDAVSLAASYEQFLLPMLNNELICAIAEADFEQPLAAVALCALFIGKDVMVLRSAVEPKTLGVLPKGSPVFMAHDKKIRRLEAMGLRLTEPGGILLSPDSKPKMTPLGQIIVEQDILSLAEKGENTLTVDAWQKLTPLAQDTAREHNIEIKRVVTER